MKATKVEKDWIHPVKDWATDPEEAANTITHGLGFVLSPLGALLMGAYLWQQTDIWRSLGCAIFLFALLGVYAMSTLSHVCATRRRHFFRRLDQGFIYLLIVATFTPFPLTFLRSFAWWTFLAGMWVIALIGFFSKILLAHRVDRVSIWVYVALGWMPIIAAPSLIGRVPAASLWWMLIGGLCYTLGTIFLFFDKRVPHFHALWHLFVIAGSTCHFFVILLYIAIG